MVGGASGAPTFLTLALDGVEWSASLSGCFNSGETVRLTHWTGGWVVSYGEEKSLALPAVKLGIFSLSAVATELSDFYIKTHMS